MSSSDQPTNPVVYTEADFDQLKLHDCYVFGISWEPAKFALNVDLDYIIEWISPVNPRDGYFFRVCRAELRFFDIIDPKITLDWAEANLAAQIDSLLRVDAGRSPNGSPLWKYTLEFSNPAAEINLTATKFELRLISEPVTLKRQHIRG